MNEQAYRPLDRVHPSRTRSESLFLAWDVAIIVLVSINLALIAVDMLFSVQPLAAALQAVSPAVHDGYLHGIHERFFAIDLGFVAIFVADVLLGWSVAIAGKRYTRWYFYPFIHWYDVLGCIPVAGFRLLRVLRVISIVIRLQHLGVIDLRHWRIYHSLAFYYDILVEEISDRVVIRVLTGAQDEIRSGGNRVTRQVLEKVVRPRQARLAQTVSARIEAAVTQAYEANRDEIHDYIALLVGNAVHGNRALKNMERVPMLGSYVTRGLEQAITGTVHDVLEEVVAGLESADFEKLVEHITETVISQMIVQGGKPSEIGAVVAEILEVVKAQVTVKKWRSHVE